MSKKFLKSAHYSVHQLIKKATGLSFQSRYGYESGLKLMMTQLHEQGYQLSNIQHLKAKHVHVLLERWQTEQLSTGTIKNRLSKIRYIAPLIRKPELLPMDNAALSVAERNYQSQHNRAIYELDISKIKDKNCQYSINLQQLFGLRREECLKFMPHVADEGNELRLKASWTKGKIERTIPITTDEQRQFIDYLRTQIQPGQSLIPAHKNYVEQLHTYVATVRQAGYKNLHGLRHAYAQTLYRRLTDEKNTRSWLGLSKTRRAKTINNSTKEN